MPGPDRTSFPLSAAQREVWLAQKLDPDNPAFNIGSYFHIPGELDVAAFRTALRRAVSESEALHVRITEDDEGRPRQTVDVREHWPLHVLDVSGDEDPWARALAWMDEDVSRPVDPAAGGLFCQALLRLGDGEHLWYVRAHHAAADGFGLYLLGCRVAALYSCLVRGRELPEPSFRPLREVVAEDDAYRRSADHADDREHWTGRFAERPALVTPARRSAKAGKTFLRSTGHLSQEQLDRLGELARGSRVRWTAVLCAAVAVYLGRIMATDDVSLGLTLTGRSGTTARSTPSQASNVLPLRLGISPWEPFSALARRASGGLMEALQTQRYRGEDLRRDLGLRGDEQLLGWHLNLVPFDYGLAFGAHRAVLHTLTLGPVDDLYIYAFSDAGGEGLRLDFYANPGRYTAEELAGHQRRIVRLLGALVDGGTLDVPVGTLETAAPEERSVLRDTAGPGAARQSPAPPERTLLDLLHGRDRRDRGAVAVADGRSRLTRPELESRSDRLARLLIREGVRPDDVVGVALPRSVEMVTAVLGVLKAGAAYLPVDLDHPPGRVAHMLRDSRVPLLLTTGAGAASGALEGSGARRLVLDGEGVRTRLSALPEGEVTDAERSGPLRPGHLAYVIYTSGSTGLPKGVAVAHRSAANYVDRATTAYPSLAGRVLLYSSLSFDITLTALFGALAAGGELIVSSVEDYAEEIRSARSYTFLKATPTHLALLDTLPDLCSPTGEFIVAGEPLAGEVLGEWRRKHPGVTVINHYGPSEATCGCVDHRIPPTAPVPAGPVPIGRPFAGARLQILDSALRPVPRGVVGELYVAGPCLARGYLDQPRLTAERFVADPSGPAGARMYRTGDLVRQRPDGEVEFTGRADHQTKIRGFRVEPGEVQSVLAAHPAVAQAVVVVREDAPGDRQLVAYVETVPGQPADAARLRAHAARALPSFMVPSLFVLLDKLPLTPNGKTDRAALPAPSRAAGGEGRPPRSPEEKVLCRLFAELLGTPGAGVTDNFFDLGGHSLSAVKLAARIRHTTGAEVSVKDVFDLPTPELLAGRLTEAGGPAPVAARNAPAQSVPLSLPQRRLWFLNQSDVPRAVYNIPFVLPLEHDVNTAALTAALGDVVERHEVLRTLYPRAGDGAGDGGGVRQEVLEALAARPAVPVTETTDAEVPGLLVRAAREPFDLTRETPLRARLFRTATGYRLLVVLHHIAGDGWSFAPFGRDLEHAYAARCRGGAPQWDPLPVQYRDYALRQQRFLSEESGALARQTAFWTEQLAGLPEELRLPSDRTRPAVASYLGGTVPVRISPALHSRLRRSADEAGATVFMALQAGLAVLLAKLGAGTDIPIGTGVAGRTDDAWDDLVGFFINTLVLRTDVSGNPTYRELLSRVRATDVAAFDHQDLPFDRLVEILNPARSMARHPLFQVLLMLRNTPRSDLCLTLDGREAEGEEIPVGFAKFDLTVSLRENSAARGECAGIEGFIEYAADLFDRETAERIAGLFVSVLEQVTARPGRPVGEVELVGGDERRRTLRERGGSAQPAAAGRPMPRVFEEQAARRPSAVAVRAGGTELSFTRLNADANRLARALLRRGAGPESCVALALPRSPELVTAVLAVLKTGAAYLPVDLDYPAGRVAAMFQDAAPGLLITTTSHQQRLRGAESGVLCADSPGFAAELAGLPASNLTDRELSAPPDARGPACVLFTSGSTGRPKGVVLTHTGTAGLAAAQAELFRVTEQSRVLQFGSPSFDAFLLEICMSLLSGACLVLAGPRDLVPDLTLGKTVTEHAVTHVTMPPSVLAAVPDGALPDGMTLVVAGERVTGALVRAWSPGRRMVNLYGPTEGSVIATWTRLRRGEEAPPIGSARPGVGLYVLDAWLRPVPRGVPGELYLTGDCLARGYVNRPVLTAERFVADPHADRPGARMYRTGDLVRRRADGQLDFIGRTDSQVKLRGFRIELGEVEAALAVLPDVARAAAVVREDTPGKRLLTGYVVPAAGADPDPRDVRRRVAGTLPAYMLPAHIVVLDGFPLNPNGKLDRAALPAPDRAAARAPHEGSPLEQKIAAVWSEVLGAPVKLTDDFFALGGHSLLAGQVLNRLRDELGTAVPIRLLFDFPTVEGLARAVTELAADEAAEGAR